MFCEVRKLLHIFWEIWCIVKPRHVICNVDLNLLRIKSQDVSSKKVDFSLNSRYKRIMRHRGLKLGILNSYRVYKLGEFQWSMNVCWKLHIWVLIWCGFTNFANTSYTHIVCFVCIVSRCTVSKRPYWL